ncbi:hypothetical protein [Butyrivibrio fibrisolvens]|uniref:hypothetical protein n=1 Tax=Butyrivibrio fibrisolvens TaxID=831 RepID=UPI00041706AA|nr:hypothetical protein [Butyrivibrio fibrisolvens]
MLFTSVLVTIFMTILKAYAWLLKQMFRLIWNVYKLFLCLFPAAGIVLAALVVFECAGYFTGNDYIGQAKEYVESYVHACDIEYFQDEKLVAKADSSYGVSGDIANSIADNLSGEISNNIANGLQQNIENGVNDISEKVTQTLLEAVTSWWEGILEKSEQKAYSIIAWAITILIGIPIFLGLLLLSAAASGVNFLGIAIIVDLAIYIFRSVFGMTTPFRQFRRRYCFLFHTKPFYDPKYEDSYQDWLKRHHDEFENDTFGTDKAEYDEAYDEEDYDRMGYADYEGKRLSRKEIRRLEKIKKRQQNYDDYYEDYYDRLEDLEEKDEEDDRFRRGRWNKRYSSGRYDDYYYDDDDDNYDDYDQDKDEDRYERIDDDDRYNRYSSYKSESSYDHQKQKQNQSYYQKSDSRSSSDPKRPSGNYSTFDFFAGCKSRDGIVKKYHSLAKLYHPDNFEGDSSAITEINRQYKEAMGKYK